MKRSIIILSVVALSGCAQDKVGHFVGGAITSIFVTEVTGSPVKGCVTALVLGVAKEAYDSKYGGTVEAADALATVGGCALTWEF